MRLFHGLCCLVAVLFPIAAISADHPELKYDVVVVNAFFDDKAMVAKVAQEREPLQVDYKKNFLTIEVTQSGYNQLLKAGFRVEVDDRRTEQHNRVYSRLPGQNRGIDGFSCYRTVDETYASAAAMAKDYPGLATWIDIGDSWEKESGLGGHDMRVLRLTNSATSGPKPKLFAMSAVHAREYTTAELTTRFAEYLLENYDSNSDVTWLLDHHEIHLSLQSNPDGRVQAQTGLSWRKNTNQNACSATSDSRGIDLNRNFGFQWGCCNGSSGNECSGTYRGATPSSEPETQSIQNYVRSIYPDQREDDLLNAAPADATGVFLDIHSFSELVLWPWGFGAQLAPNAAGLQTLGRRFSWFNNYYPEQAIGLYPTDGTTDDFAYGELGLAAYTFELGTTFFQDCGTFENTILPDNLEALIYAAKVARTPYLTPAGPDSIGVTLDNAVVGPGTVIALNALADDTRLSTANGSDPVQSISAAEYYIDIPPWGGESAQPNAMVAVDGSFSSSVEAITAAIDTSGLDQGRHIIFVRAQDAAGNWGPFSSAFLYLIDPATAPTITGSVIAADSGQPLAAEVSAGSPFTTSTAADGSFNLQLVTGSYDLAVTPESMDYAPANVAGISIGNAETLNQDFVLYPYCDLFVDDVESGNAGWSAQAPWGITTELSNSASNSWTDSPGSDYNNNVSVALTSPVIDISGAQGLRIEFASFCETESTYDFCILEINADGSWNEIARFDGFNTSWQNLQFDLPQLVGAASFSFRFRLESDVSIVENGWHVDDIRVRGAGPQCLTADSDADGVDNAADNCTNVFNPNQRDSNGDGFGNVCDADLDGNNVVDFLDLNILSENFFVEGDLDTDFDGNGQTDFVDLNIMAEFFFLPPGPAAGQ